MAVFSLRRPRLQGMAASNAGPHAKDARGEDLALPLLSAQAPRTLTRTVLHVQAAEDLRRPAQITASESLPALSRTLPRSRQLLAPTDSAKLRAREN